MLQPLKSKTQLPANTINVQEHVAEHASEHQKF